MLLVQIPVIPTTTPSTSMLVRDSQINPTMPLSWILLWELIRHAPRPGSYMYEQTMIWKDVVSRIPPRYLSHKPFVHPLLNDKNMTPCLLPGSPLYYTDLYTWLTFQIILNAPKKTDYASNVFVPALFRLPCD